MIQLAGKKKTPKKDKFNKAKGNHNLADKSNLKFLNHSSYLWALVGADMTAMKYRVSFLNIKTSVFCAVF